MSTNSMTPAQKQIKLKQVLALAVTQIGVHEQPHFSNRGQSVEAYLHSVGLDGGNSWCMAFQYWLFDRCDYVIVNGVNILARTGSCQVQADHAKGLGLLVSSSDAKTQLAPGWIMLQWHPELNRYAHTGLVTSYDAASGVFHTIEGNSTNDPAEREGDAVVRQTRQIGDTPGNHPRYAFIRTS